MVMSHNTRTERERERELGRIQILKLKALARKASNGVGSPWSFGGSPGTVGIARTQKS